MICNGKNIFCIPLYSSDNKIFTPDVSCTDQILVNKILTPDVLSCVHNIILQDQ